MRTTMGALDDGRKVNRIVLADVLAFDLRNSEGSSARLSGPPTSYRTPGPEAPNGRLQAMSMDNHPG